MGDQVLEHPDFQGQVALAWQDILRENCGATGLGKLQFLKKAMRNAEKALNTRAGGAPFAEHLEDRIGVAMKFFRLSEAGAPERVSSCLERYPLLSDLVRNPYDFISPSGPRLARLRRHIMELQREFTMKEFTSLHEDLKELGPKQAARRRKNNHMLVCRLAPG